jgi:hypothetical protein
MDIVHKKYAIYTTLFGNYETLNELEISKRHDVSYVVFTDDPELKSSTWEVRCIKPVFPDDSVRSQRYVKILAHKFLNENFVLYIDNTVKLKSDPIPLFKVFNLKKCGLAFPDHDYRATVEDEFTAVLELKLDEERVLINFLETYKRFHPEVLDSKPYWTGFFFRDLRNKDVLQVMENWAFLVTRYSRRDQLSLNLALKNFHFKPIRLQFPLLKSEWHEWPIHSNRANNKF